MKSGRGGARKGAGRKTSNIERSRRLIYLSDNEHVLLKTIGGSKFVRDCLSISGAIIKMLEGGNDQ